MLNPTRTSTAAARRRKPLPFFVLLALGTAAACDTSQTGDSGPQSTPRVVSTIPEAEARDVAVDGGLQVLFSEAMSPSVGSVQLNSGNGVDLSWDGAGTTLTIQPQSALPPGRRIEVTLDGAFAAATGQRGAGPYRFAFTTAPFDPCAADSAAPILLDGAPIAVAAGVRETTVTLSFDEPVIGLGPSAITLDGSPGAGHLSSVTANRDRTSFALRLTALADGDSYTLAIGAPAGDACGNVLEPAVIQTVTVDDACAADTSAPARLSAGNAVVPAHTPRYIYTLEFDEPVFNLGGSAISIGATDPTATGWVSTMAGDGSGLRFDVQFEDLRHGDTITLQVHAPAADRCGNVATTVVYLTVDDPCSGDSSAPQFTSATTVDLAAYTTQATYAFVFDEWVLGADAATVTLTPTAGPGGAAITNVATVGDTIYVDVAGLANGDRYDLTATTGVSDGCGNALASAATVVISVEDPCLLDTAAPLLQGPTAGRVELSQRTWLLQFDEPVVDLAANLTLTALQGVGSDTFFWVAALAPNLYEVWFRANDWQPADRFQLSVGAAVADLCGNATTPVDIALDIVDCVGDSSAPQVSSATGVVYLPGDATYRLRFSEPVTGVAIGSLGWSGGPGGATVSSVTMVGPADYDIAITGLVDGDQYSLAVGAGIDDLCFNSAQPTTIALQSANTIPPANSEGIINLNSAGTTLAGLTQYSTTPGLPVNDTAPSCGFNVADLAFQYTVQRSGALVVTTDGSNFDTVLEVLGADGSTSLGCNDDYGGGWQSRVQLASCASAGDLLYIAVDGFWGGGESLTLNVFESGPALNLSPANGAVDVSLAANLTYVSSGPLNPTAGTVSLAGDQGFAASYTLGTAPEVTFANNNHTMTINPAAPFGASETITVTLAGVVDICGVAAADPWQFTTRAAAAALVINELDPGGPDWIELYNPTAAAVTMTGWAVNFPGFGGLYMLPAGFVLPAGGYVQITESAGSNSATVLHTPFQIGYTASGAVALLDDMGQGVDFVRFGGSVVAPPAGTSWSGANPIAPAMGLTLGRDQAGSDSDDGSDWENSCGIDATVPTPGAANSSTAPPPSITITSPNGGETLYQGSTVNLTWNSTGIAGSVDLLYSTDGGNNWLVIGQAAANGSPFAWSVPAGVISSQCLFAVVESGGAAFDISVGLFTIAAAPPACAYHFDDGTLQGWTVSNTSAAVGWRVMNTRALSGSWSLYYGNATASSYETVGVANAGSATSPWINAAAGAAELRFSIWLDSEGAPYDLTALAIDDGTALTPLWDTGMNTNLADGSSEGVFVPIIVDLAAYAGTTIRLVFSFDTIDEFNNTFEGPHIDAVSVTGACL